MINEVDQPKEPPQIAVKFANIVFALGILYSILLIVYGVYKIYNLPEPVSPAFYIISMLCGGVFASLFGLGLTRLSSNLKVNLSVLFFTAGIAVYGFETYSEFFIKDNYNTYFGEDRFIDRNYYGGAYAKKKNDNNYTVFSANDMDFIVINLGWEPDVNEIKWGENLLQTYSRHRAIVVSHYILANDANDSFSQQGQNIYNALKDNPNLFLMLSGHEQGENMRTDIYNKESGTYNDDYRIYSLLADFTNRNGGNGWLRILQFSPTNNEIRIKTYSPLLDKWETDENSEFTLPYNMSDPVLSSIEDQTTNSSVAKEDFSIIVLPDTQIYSESFPSIFNVQTQWIVDNYDTWNIVYVAHTGDIVDNHYSTEEWRNANRAMRILEEAVSERFPNGIPYGIVPGNHDLQIKYRTKQRIINLLKLTNLRIMIYAIFLPPWSDI
ncbi:metallophosphoesterase [Alphaproteobacteria bacterium]|nr:metallophosphoesterase [Alphaproteobacteria bacterium]